MLGSLRFSRVSALSTFKRGVSFEMLPMFPEFAKGLKNYESGSFVSAAMDFNRVSETIDQFAKGNKDSRGATIFTGMSYLMANDHNHASKVFAALSKDEQLKTLISEIQNYINCENTSSISELNLSTEIDSVLKNVKDFVAFPASGGADALISSLQALLPSEIPAPSAAQDVPTLLAASLKRDAAVHASIVLLSAVASVAEAAVAHALSSVDFSSPAQVLSAKAAMQVKEASKAEGGELAAAEKTLKAALKILQAAAAMPGVVTSDVETVTTVEAAWLRSLLAKCLAVSTTDPIVCEGLSRGALTMLDSVPEHMHGGANLAKTEAFLRKKKEMLATHGYIMKFWENREEEALKYEKMAAAVETKGEYKLTFSVRPSMGDILRKL